MTWDLSPRAAVFVLMGILAIGLLLRWEAFLGSPVRDPLRADAARYFAAAYHLRYAGVYSTSLDRLTPGSAPVPDAARSPGYPLFLVPFLDPVPTQAVLTRIVFGQILVGTASILLVYLLGARLLGRVWGLAAALLTAISPHLVNAGLYILTETLLGFLLLAFVWALSRWGRATPPKLLATGALLGLAALVHPSLQHFILAWLVLVWLCLPRPRPRSWSVPLLLLLGFALVFGPWAGRNLLLFGSTGDDRPIVNTLRHGLYPGLMYQDRPESYGYPYHFDPRAAEIGADLSSVLTEIAHRFSDAPGRHLHWFLIGKPITMWSWDAVQGAGDAFIYPVTDSPYWHHPGFQATHRLMWLLHWPLVVFAAIGVVLVWLPAVARRFDGVQRLALRTIALLLLYLTLVHMVGTPLPRYATPLRPMLYLAALLPLAVLLPHARLGQLTPPKVG